MPPTANYAISDSTNILATVQSQKETVGMTIPSDQDASFATEHSIFSVSPNPTRNQANVSYQFLKATDVTVEVKTASGQVIFSRLLRGATVGSLDIPMVDYPNGTYFVSLQDGKKMKTQKLVVSH